MTQTLRLVSLCVPVVVAFAAATAQAPLKPRPSVGPPKPFTAPKVEERTYPNGMRVALVPFRASPTARIELVIRAGSADENPEAPAVAGIVAQSLVEGTLSRSSESIAQLLSDLGTLGGAISISAGPYETILAADVLPESAPAMIELLADLVQHPSFPAPSVDRLKSNAIRRLELQRNQPDWMASSRTNSILFQGNPADRVPSEAQIQGVALAAVTSFHSRYYAPTRSRLYVAGTFDKPAVERAASVFGNWRTSGSPPFVLPRASAWRELSAPGRPVIHLIDRPGATQARVQVSFPVVDLPHPDHMTLNEINTLMGSMQTARIVANIRERNGYSYNISTRLVRRPGSTQWIVAGDITNNVVGAALRETLAEIARLRAEAPSRDELQGFQSFMAGVLISEQSTAQGMLESLRWMDLYGVDPAYLGTLVQSVHAVTPENIQLIAARYLTPSRMTIVVVGDRKALVSQLEEVGQVID
jgi:zinc protease